jgi:hypothetical protein
MRLSVLVASSGRPTLARTLQSIGSQLSPGDELIVDCNDDAPYGNEARNRMMLRARGSHLMFLDDDDLYLPGAFDAVRAGVAQDPSRMHMFKMRYPPRHYIFPSLDDGDGSGPYEIWVKPEIAPGNVSTQIVVVPRVYEKLGTWSARYEGDLDFITSTSKLMGEPIWHTDVIALIRPEEQ